MGYDDEIGYRLAQAGAHGEPELYIYEAIDRFRRMHAPKKLAEPARDEDKLRQISARIPEGVIQHADSIGEMLSYSRNEIIIKALQFYCETIGGEVRGYASNYQQETKDSTLLDAVDRQLDIFSEKY